MRQETLDPGRHGEIEPPRIALPRQGRIAVGADIGAGGEDDPRDEGIERALAVDVEIDRRQVGKLREMRDQPTLRLMRLDLDGQALRLRHQADLDVDGAGLIEALRREGEVEPFGRWAELGFALGRKACRLAEERFAEHKLLQRKTLDLDLERKLRQERRFRSGLFRSRWHGLTGYRQLADLEPVDLETARKKCGARPDEAGSVKHQPRPVLVGNDDVADRRIR